MKQVLEGVVFVDIHTDSCRHHGPIVVLSSFALSPQLHSWCPCVLAVRKGSVSAGSQKRVGYTDVLTKPCLHPLMAKLTSLGPQQTLPHLQMPKV